MCGICGCHSDAGSAKRAQAMLGRLLHRGPDDEGIYVDGPMALGHRRLSIVDLSQRGHQPMVTPDGRFAVVVNGEIYNYPALRAELEARGAKFNSDSDSEVTLHAFAAWGTESFKRFNGMFAFALWDALEKRLYLVRDRLGIKPVYYLAEPGAFTFASEVKALVAAHPRDRWAIDATALGQYLTFENMLGGASLLSGIRMVRPGHYVEVTRDGAAEHAYWHPSRARAQVSALSFDEAAELFRATFKKAVDRHLMSDLPVATYLSAGLDSTMVAAQAARLLKEPPAAFTGYFADGGWYDELKGARLVADHIGAPITPLRIDAADFEQAFDAVVLALDEPRMGIGALPQYLIAAKAAETRKVILTGHGGDELFSGYPVFKLALLMGALRTGHPGLLATLGALRPSELPHLVYFAAKGVRRREASQFLPTLFTHRFQSEILLPEVARAVDAARDETLIETIAGAAQSPYEEVLQTYLQVYLPGLLVVEDKISMAHTLESRTPLLDNELVELSLSLPEAIKLHGGRLKALNKKVAADLLPRELLAMPKRGFPTPLASWLRGPLRDWMKTRISGRNPYLARLFRREYLDRACDAYVGSWRRASRPLDEIQTHRMWMLLSLESWMRQYEEGLGVALVPSPV